MPLTILEDLWRIIQDISASILLVSFEISTSSVDRRLKKVLDPVQLVCQKGRSLIKLQKSLETKGVMF